MSADLRLVANAAQRHADELPAKRAGDGASQRCLPDTGWSDEAEYLSFEPAHEREHRDEVEDAILDFVEPIMIGVENRAGVGYVEDFVRSLIPWDRHDPVDEVARHRELGRHRRHAPELSQLAQRSLLYHRRERLFPDLRLELGEVVSILFAQLPVNHPQLLLQVELALVLEHRAAHVVVDFPLESEQLDLAGEQLPQHFQEVA